MVITVRAPTECTSAKAVVHTLGGVTLRWDADESGGGDGSDDTECTVRVMYSIVQGKNTLRHLRFWVNENKERTKKEFHEMVLESGRDTPLVIHFTSQASKVTYHITVERIVPGAPPPQPPVKDVKRKGKMKKKKEQSEENEGDEQKKNPNIDTAEVRFIFTGTKRTRFLQESESNQYYQAVLMDKQSKVHNMRSRQLLDRSCAIYNLQ